MRKPDQYKATYVAIPTASAVQIFMKAVNCRPSGKKMTLISSFFFKKLLSFLLLSFLLLSSEFSRTWLRLRLLDSWLGQADSWLATARPLARLAKLIQASRARDNFVTGEATFAASQAVGLPARK